MKITDSARATGCARGGVIQSSVPAEMTWKYVMMLPVQDRMGLLCPRGADARRGVFSATDQLYKASASGFKCENTLSRFKQNGEVHNAHPDRNALVLIEVQGFCCALGRDPCDVRRGPYPGQQGRTVLCRPRNPS